MFKEYNKMQKLTKYQRFQVIIKILENDFKGIARNVKENLNKRQNTRISKTCLKICQKCKVNVKLT